MSVGSAASMNLPDVVEDAVVDTEETAGDATRAVLSSSRSIYSTKSANRRENQKG
jgi:hypothetical protein